MWGRPSRWRGSVFFENRGGGVSEEAGSGYRVRSQGGGGSKKMFYLSGPGLLPIPFHLKSSSVMTGVWGSFSQNNLFNRTAYRGSPFQGNSSDHTDKRKSTKYHPFQSHYTHKIIIFKLFRSLQLQFSGSTGINFRYSYSFVGLTGICLYSYSSVQLHKKWSSE